MTAALRPPDWRRIFDAADRALELDAGERLAFLALCATDDPALAENVRALLESGEAASPLDHPAAEFAAPMMRELVPAITADVPDTWFGPYRIIRELGRGGMGAVYLAERSDDQYQKQVALKILPAWSAGDERKVQRFLDERQILAALDHPDIAGLLDGGITTEGVPWFAMEFVEGLHIDRYCDERSMSIEERLHLFCRVCGAVQYAHRNLVVHRDLKPANILVTAEGRVRLLDFGIAKLMRGSVASLELTIPGERILTPLYASPEQIRGEPISTASDVYSLGVLLNVLITGQYPYRLANLEHHDVARIVLEHEPLRPSAGVIAAERPGSRDATAERAAAARRSTPAKLQRRLAGDLDAVVLKALDKDPSRRYASAEQLETELSRHLAGLPVSARPVTRAYHARKFVRRHRAGVTIAAAVAVLVLTFGIVATFQSSQIRAQARRIAVERDRAMEANRFLTKLFRTAVPGHFDRGVTSRDILDSATARIEREGLSDPEQRANLMVEMARTYHALNIHDQARTIAERSVTLRRTMQPQSNLELAESLDLLGSILLAQNQVGPAESGYREALSLRRGLRPASDRDIARTLVGLASTLRADRQLAEAESLSRQALALDEGRRGDTRADVAESTTGLARVLLDKGEHREAMRHFRNALALVRQGNPEEHVDVAGAVFDLAGALKLSGDKQAGDSLTRYGTGLYRRLVSVATFSGTASGAALPGASSANATPAGTSARGQPTNPGGTVPDDSRILFTTDRHGPDPVGDMGNQDLYVMRADGTGQRRLTFHPGVDNGGSWSPDGRTIAFGSDREGLPEVFLMNADGTNQRRLTNLAPSGIGATQPSWAPDGKRIAFRSRLRQDIYVINTDGTGLRNLTNHPAVDNAPVWSPDGRKIAFFSDRDGKPGIYIMNPDGTGVVRLVENTKRKVSPYIAWSPDGRRLAFNSERDGDPEIYVVSSDGTGLTRLTNSPGEDAFATWSPDGRQMSFHRRVLGHGQIYVMNADGTGVRRLTELSGVSFNGFPKWGPRLR